MGASELAMKHVRCTVLRCQLENGKLQLTKFYPYLTGCDVDCLQDGYIASFAPESLTVDVEYTSPHQAHIVAKWQYISEYALICICSTVYTYTH